MSDVYGLSGKIAAAAKVGPKGQIVIPKDIRTMFSIEPGDTVLVLADVDQGIAMMPIKKSEELFQAAFDNLPSLDDEIAAAKAHGKTGEKPSGKSRGKSNSKGKASSQAKQGGEAPSGEAAE